MTLNSNYFIRLVEHQRSEDEVNSFSDHAVRVEKKEFFQLFPFVNVGHSNGIKFSHNSVVFVLKYLIIQDALLARHPLRSHHNLEPIYIL